MTRLIDADELKKCAIPCTIHNGALTDLCVPLYQIDTAPTVETPTWTDVIESNKAGYNTARRLYERPQGEWGKWVISEIRCPNCLEYFDTDCYSEGELNKCPSCGTVMRGRENE